MTLLGIDTSGKTASVALCTEDKVLAQTTVYTSLTHSQVILPLCNDVLKNAGVELSDVDGIAVAMGPGSYTGLRIGISAVKAICFAQNKPCIGISTLEGLANNVSLHKGKICAVMTARLDLVYCALFESDGCKVKRLTNDEILSIDDLKVMQLINLRMSVLWLHLLILSFSLQQVCVQQLLARKCPHLISLMLHICR